MVAPLAGAEWKYQIDGRGGRKGKGKGKVWCEGSGESMGRVKCEVRRQGKGREGKERKGKGRRRLGVKKRKRWQAGSGQYIMIHPRGR